MEAYRRIAPWYDVIIGPLLAPARRLVRRWHTPAPGSTVLDIGCGTGAQLRLYAGLGCRLEGVDPSPSMVSEARRALGAAATIHLADGSSLPFPDAAVDLVLLSMALHEMSRPTRTAVLSEAARVLAPGGRMLVLDYEAAPARGLRGRAARRGIQVIEWLAGRDHFRHYREFMADGGLPPLLPRHGLGIKAARALAGANLGLFLIQRHQA